MLICPKCKKELKKEDHCYRCPEGHSFDIARQGYVNLSLKQKKNQGDNRLMVLARSKFLEEDHYDFMRQFVKDKLVDHNIHTLIDGVCGQGYYTKEFKQVVDTVYGIDLSKEAIRYAAAHDKQSQYFVAGIFDMPFSDHSADCITSIFTPLQHEEVYRVLRENGIWIVVGPGPDHCIELKELMYDRPYKNDWPDTHMDHFECVSQDLISNKAVVEDVWSLLEMTPYRYNSPSSSLDKVKACKSLDTTFEFVVSIWRKI